MIARLAVAILLPALAGCGTPDKPRAPTPERLAPAEVASAGDAATANAPAASRSATRTDPPTNSLFLATSPSPSLAAADDPSNPPEKQARCLKDAIGYAKISDDLSGCLAQSGHEPNTELRIDVGVELTLKAVRTSGEGPAPLLSCVQNVLDGARKKLHAYCYSTRAVLTLHWNARGVRGRGAEGGSGYSR